MNDERIEEFRMLKNLLLPDGVKPIDEYLSKKIAIMYFFCTLAVVMSHGYNFSWVQYPPENPGWSYYVETFLCLQFSVPLLAFFFACSGFLLCASLQDDKLKTLLGKLKKRIKTVFLPWFLWVTLGIGFFLVVMRIGVPTPITEIVKGPEPVYNTIKACYWDNAIIHFWFLKRLMLYFILTPIFIFLIKKLSIFLLLIVTMLSFSMEFTYIDLHLVCYLLGMMIALYRIDIRKPAPWYMGCIIFAVWFILCIYLKDIFGLKEDSFDLKIFRRFLGVMAYWTFYDTIYPVLRKVEKYLLALSPFSFFIYCVHPFPQAFFMRFCSPWFSHEAVRFVVEWIVIVIVCLLAGFIMRKIMKPVYSILSGSR